MDSHPEHPAVPFALYVAVWAGLIVLTGVTLGVSYLDLQNVGIQVALLIATAKAALVLLYFVCCGVSRLARYNVTAESLSAGADKVAYFEGTPIPTSVLLTAILATLAWQGRLGDSIPGGAWALGPWTLHPLALLFALSGTLMISKTLRIPKL